MAGVGTLLYLRHRTQSFGKLIGTRFMMIWRVVVAGIAIWRLSRWLLGDASIHRSPSRFQLPGSFFSNRVMDCACWLTICLSAQTAMWVAGGLASVVLSLSLISVCCRLLVMRTEIARKKALHVKLPVQLRTVAPTGDLSCLTVEHGMQANHG